MILGGLLTVRQASLELGLTVRQIHHRIESGEIVAEKVGDGLRAPLLISRDEIDRYRTEQAS